MMTEEEFWEYVEWERLSDEEKKEEELNNGTND